MQKHSAVECSARITMNICLETHWVYGQKGSKTKERVLLNYTAVLADSWNDRKLVEALD